MSWKDLITWNQKKDGYNNPVKVDTAMDQHPMVMFHREMDRLFQDFFKDFWSPSTFWGREGGSMFSPKLNVSEDEKQIDVTLEIPGMDEKDIRISLKDDILSIKGTKNQEKEDKQKEYHHIERSYGSFQRSIQLPCEVQADKVQASFKKGVLSVTLPKVENAQSRVRIIPVQGN
ncbi:MAG: Hsp20/alpha crystallin family protein [SAR324 cluster bacterium]|nr:Hsp20/alpha crystallin family protein [SAR324 cluster bacterium]